MFIMFAIAFVCFITVLGLLYHAHLSAPIYYTPTDLMGYSKGYALPGSKTTPQWTESQVSISWVESADGKISLVTSQKCPDVIPNWMEQEGLGGA